MLRYKTLCYKLVSTIFTVLSSLPVGFEGPMISIGAMVAGIRNLFLFVLGVSEHRFTYAFDSSCNGEAK
jgi:H+/Cl- antiporter ClcA